MPEIYRDATPDDLPEDVMSGIQAAPMRGRTQRRNAPIVQEIVARRRQGQGASDHQADSRSTTTLLSDAQAAIERSRQLRADIAARRGNPQSGSSPRRAIGSEVQNALAEVHRAVAEMRGEHEQHQRAVRRGNDDVISREKIARLDRRINDAEDRERVLARRDRQSDAMQAMARQLDTQAQQIRALRTGRFGDDVSTADARGRRLTAHAHDYIRNFNAYLRHDDEGARRAMRAAMTTREDTGGGYFLPEEWDRTMSGLLTNMSVMRQVATVRTIGGPILKKAKRLNGATARWVGETTAPMETAVSTIAELEFTVMTMEGFPLITQELLEDADVDLEAWLAEDVQESFTALENPAFITGTGAKQPRGLLSYSFVANATYEAAPATYWGKFGYIATGVSGDWAASSPSDVFFDMENALRVGYRPGASWLANRPLVTEIRKMKDGDGNYLWQKGDIQAGKPATLLTYPINEDDYMPAKAANSYSLGFGDWAKTYLILDRLGSTVLRDPYTQKPYVCFYTRKRVGGAVQEFQSAKFLKFGTS